MKIINIINDTSYLLFEANLVNAGKQPIIIYDANGDEIEILHTFDDILTKFLNTSIFTTRTTPQVKQWFERNFKNWIKRGAVDVGDCIPTMDERQFQDTFYVPLQTFIAELLEDESDLVDEGLLSPEIVMNSFPDYVKNNSSDAVVFSGGRLFRLKRLQSYLGELQDYLIAHVQNQAERNDNIMPPDFMVSTIDKLQVPDAIRRAIAWHAWVKQNAEKVSYEQAVQLVNTLKPSIDYVVLDMIGDTSMVQLLTAKAASVEGTIMKHCVASYGRDVEAKKTTIYSFRDGNNVPFATAELKNGKHANQFKGPHNSTIKPEFQDVVREYLKKHKITVAAHDVPKFGGWKSNETT